MPIWVIQRVEALTTNNRWDIAKDDEPLFVDRFPNKNDFDASLNEGGISGVVQDDDDQNGKKISNTDEDS